MESHSSTWSLTVSVLFQTQNQETITFMSLCFKTCATVKVLLRFIQPLGLQKTSKQSGHKLHVQNVYHRCDRTLRPALVTQRASVHEKCSTKPKTLLCMSAMRGHRFCCLLPEMCQESLGFSLTDLVFGHMVHILLRLLKVQSRKKHFGLLYFVYDYKFLWSWLNRENKLWQKVIGEFLSPWTSSWHPENQPGEYEKSEQKLLGNIFLYLLICLLFWSILWMLKWVKVRQLSLVCLLLSVREN